MTLKEAFSLLITQPLWYKNSDYIRQQAVRDKRLFLAGRSIPEERMRHYLKTAGWEQTQEEQWEKEYMRCLKAYLDYRIMLLEWKEKYRPKTRTEEWNDRFTTALRELVIVNYYLDTLLFGEPADKETIVREKREEIENIERKCKRYFNERGKRFDKENDSYGEPRGLSGNQRNPEYDGKRDSQKFNGELCDRIKKRSAVSR